MSTYTLTANKSGGYGYSTPDSNFQAPTVQYGAGDNLAMTFPALPAAYQYKKINSVIPYVYASWLSSVGGSATIYFSDFTAAADPEKITYSNSTPTSSYTVSRATASSHALPGWVYGTAADGSLMLSNIRNLLKYGMSVTFSLVALYTTLSSYKPYLLIDFDAADVGISIESVSYINNSAAGRGIVNKFAWYAKPATTATYLPVKQASAQFQWRVGSSGTVHTISCGAADSSNRYELSVQAGTFPAGEIQWRVVVTGNNGATATSDWFSRTVYDAVIRNPSPAGGTVPKALPATFSWKLSQKMSEHSTTSDVNLTQKTATFRWRTAAGAAATEISCGTASSVTIPAGTFTTNTIQWQVTAATAEGVSATSDWMTISTLEQAGTAETVAPSGIVIDASASNVFKWQHVISTGTAQTKAELQISPDNSRWSALATVTGPSDTYTVPANTISSGTKYWRVRTYNSDGVVSEWSAAAQFVAVGAPDAPVVVIGTTSPRPAISWQVEGQQAYQVEIDGGYTSGTRFGTGKTWKAPFYLADGSYTVRVRVQNEYGFWSPWGTAALPATNVPGGAITLTAEGGIEAALSWTPGSFDYYLVYRDGVAIAKVTEPCYADAASIGGVRYQVRGCYDNSDNYSLSEAVEATVSTDKVRLYDMERGEWLHFLYDSSAHRSTGLSLSQDIQYVQLSGHTYPVAERSEFKSRALRITCVCADDAERQSLRALLGHLTCCKTPEGNMTIGYPASISESSDDFFSTYSFTIEQIDRKEEIDLDS